MPAPILKTADAQFPFILGEPDANTVTRNVSQTILSDQAQVASVFRLAADRLFFFGAFNPGHDGSYGQEAEDNYIDADCDNTFFAGADANISGYDYIDNIVQYLGFTDRFFAPDVQNAFFSSGNAKNEVTEAVAVDVDNAFNWIDHGFPRVLFPPFPTLAAVVAYAAADTMLDETLSFGQDEIVENFFSLEDLVDSSASEYARGPEQSVIKQHLTLSITGPGTKCPIEKEYAPLKGSSDDPTFPDISASPPVLGSATLTLTYPRVTPTLTLEMKNPAFGNTDTITFAKIDRTTRGGERDIFSDPKWGDWQIFELRFLNICDPATDTLFDFLNQSIGKEIGLLDWENRQWKGVILAPNTLVTSTGRTQNNGNEIYEVSLIFQGELV